MRSIYHPFTVLTSWLWWGYMRLISGGLNNGISVLGTYPVPELYRRNAPEIGLDI